MPRRVLRTRPGDVSPLAALDLANGSPRPGRLGSATTALALVLAMAAPSSAALAEGLGTPAAAVPDRSPVRPSAVGWSAVPGVASVVLGHPDTASTRREVAADVDVAIRRVTGLWGPGWSGRVTVVLPDSQQEAADLVGPGVVLDHLAAVATADRVVLNPRNFLTLSMVGRNLVLTHEVMHLASRAATGPDTPLWLVEGLADYAGYLGLGVPVEVAAGQVSAGLRRGEPVTTLPGRAAFDGVNPDLAASYELAWLAVVRIAERFGQDRLLALYRATGTAASPAATGTAAPPAATERAFTTVLGTTVAAFEQEWAAHLTAMLG